jgi:hypothetical protein
MKPWVELEVGAMQWCWYAASLCKHQVAECHLVAIRELGRILCACQLKPVNSSYELQGNLCS